jgi:hypothetical protein
VYDALFTARQEMGTAVGEGDRALAPDRVDRAETAIATLVPAAVAAAREAGRSDVRIRRRLAAAGHPVTDADGLTADGVTRLLRTPSAELAAVGAAHDEVWRARTVEERERALAEADRRAERVWQRAAELGLPAWRTRGLLAARGHGDTVRTGTRARTPGSRRVATGAANDGDSAHRGPRQDRGPPAPVLRRAEGRSTTRRIRSLVERRHTAAPAGAGHPSRDQLTGLTVDDLPTGRRPERCTGPRGRRARAGRRGRCRRR